MTQPHHGEHMDQHPEDAAGADRTHKNGSPVPPSLPDPNTGSKGESTHTQRSSFTLDELTTHALGMLDLGHRQGRRAGALETERRLRAQHARELEEAEYRGLTKQVTRREAQRIVAALRDAAIADRCPTCSQVLPLTTGHDDTEGAR